MLSLLTPASFWYEKYHSMFGAKGRKKINPFPILTDIAYGLEI